MLTSTRRGIVYPNTNRSDSADVPRDTAALVAALEIDVIYGQGTLAARPTSSGGSPGIQGRVYYATDNSTLYWDFGTGWQSIGAVSAGSIGTTQLADGSVTTIKIADGNVTLIKMAANSVDASKIVDGSVTATELAAALFPSQGAGGATEALRAIGAGAGNVVAGNDTRLTDQRVPTNSSVTPSKVDFTQVFNFTAAGGLQAQGMRVQRHPYANDRHIESGGVTFGSVANGGTSTVAVTFASAATSTVNPVVSIAESPGAGGYSAIANNITTTGFNFIAGNITGGAQSMFGRWIADMV